MEVALSDNDQRNLRAEGVINEQEVALQIGDLIVAENVTTRDRRVVRRVVGNVQEGRRILKD
jgi:hypothetical protein